MSICSVILITNCKAASSVECHRLKLRITHSYNDIIMYNSKQLSFGNVRPKTQHAPTPNGKL